MSLRPLGFWSLLASIFVVGCAAEGARTLLVSHWPVEAGAAVELFTSMVALDLDELGRSRAELLTLVMRRMLQAGGVAGAEGEVLHAYAHPVFWAPFAALQPTDGRWFPLGFTEGVRDRAFYITDQVPMLEMFRWLEDAINYGEDYEKLPRVVPYTILPIGCALILYRFCEAAWGVATDKRESLIVSHEAEEAVEEAAALQREQG